MNRIDRLNSIHILLQSRHSITAQEIANEFVISLRTVYRDIRSLEAAGVPILGEAGFGYSLAKGYSLAPISFSQEEAIALLVAGKIMDKTMGDSLPYNEALTKVRSTLNETQKGNLQSLEDSIAVHTPKTSKQASKLTYLAPIHSAMLQNKTLSLNYYSAYNDSKTKRDVDPIGTIHYGDHWHLIAWCHKREDYRDFRLDRIQNLEITRKVFANHSYQNLKEYVKAFQNEFPEQMFHLAFPLDVAKCISEKKYHMGFVQETEKNGYLEMSFLFTDIDYFARWTLMFGKDVIIKSPQSLKDRRINLIQELQKTIS